MRFVGQLQGSKYWEFPGLRGVWNSTTWGAAKTIPGGRGWVFPDLTAQEIAALEAAAERAGLRRG